MAMDEVGLGKSIQKARQDHGLTQQELCQRAGLSYSTLAKIERGAIKAPSIFTIQKIAEVLGVELTSLIGGSGPAIKQPALPKRSKTGISFVYFDVNGCLVRFFHKAFTKIGTETGCSSEKIESAFWHYNDSVCRGEMSVEEFNAKLCEKAAIRPINWLDYYLDAVEPIPQMTELVKWVASQYQVGLLTNIMPGLIDALRQRQLIPDVNYAAIIDSSQVGALKPEPKIYEIAQSMASVPPHEILLVDDSRTNLVAAEHLNWRVLWFDNYEPEESIPKIKFLLEPEQAEATFNS